MKGKDNSRVRSTVAAIVPNYNYADFIIERIDSIMAQTYPVSELIILDDASTDNSVEIIKEKIDSIKRRYKNIRVKLIVNDVNSGGCVFSQWQKGLRLIESDFFWIAEADDVADKNFLKVAMKKFEEYPSAALFYCDSYRIDQEGEIISETCADWADMWKNGRWGKDYFNNGKDEVINYLGETNPILNVSSVVWRNKDGLIDIFDEAKEFKVAGDWYIYTRVLEDGDVVYCANSLNRYRKHEKGSASSVVKLSTEYREVVAIQERVARKYELSDENLEWQKYRRRGMGMVENKNNIDERGRIAWFVPDFLKGSGGHRTIFQNVNYLVSRGFACDIYVKTVYNQSMLPNEIYKNILEWYGDFYGDVFVNYELVRDYDMVIATGWETVEPVVRVECKRKMYFIQDFEPWFFPMGQDYIAAEGSYRHKLDGVSIGKWLPVKLKKEYGLGVVPFSFGADLKVYKRLKKIKKERAVCFIFQPGKPRRCTDLGLKALKIVRELRPNVKIYLFGSEKVEMDDDMVEHLGVLTPEECNSLYNKCEVGLCFSASNPSRLPFEMMAAGLPVVDLYLDNNLYDFPDGGCLLAQPEPAAVATAIIKILDSEDLRRKMSSCGVKYMMDFPLERGFREFGDIVSGRMLGKKRDVYQSVKLYKKMPVEPSNEAVLMYELNRNSGREAINVKVKTGEEIWREQDRAWRENLTIIQRIYLRIRYVLIGR